MTYESRKKKISSFTVDDALTDSSTFDFIKNGINKKTSWQNILDKFSEVYGLGARIFDTEADLIASDIQIDEHAIVVSNNYGLYKITSLAAGAQDVTLTSGFVATLQAALDVPAPADYTELRSIETAGLLDGTPIKVTNSGIAGDFVLVNSVAHGLTDNGGTIIVINSNWYARRLNQEGGIIRAEWFGYVADYTTTNTDNTAAIQAAIDATPIGGICLLPDGDARFGSQINITKTMLFSGTGTTTKQQSDSPEGFSGTRLFYSGINRAIYIQCINTVSLNGADLANFELRPTVDGVTVDGIYYDPGPYSVFSCTNTNVKVYRFGSAQYATPAYGDIWDINWIGGSIVTDEGSIRHGIDFSGTGIKYGTIDGTYIQSRAPGQYGCYMSSALKVTNGIMELSGIGGGSGYNIGSGSCIVGTHIEAYLQSGTIGCYTRGTNITFIPSTCQSCDWGIQVESTNTIIDGHFAASVTRDILIVAGGSRAGVLIYSADYTLQDNRRDVDGVNEVVELGSVNWRLNRSILRTLGVSSTAVASKNLAGTLTVVGASFTGAVTFATAELDANYRLSITAVDSSGGTPAANSSVIRSVAKTTTGFTVTVEAQPGSGVTVNFDWLLLR